MSVISGEHLIINLVCLNYFMTIYSTNKIIILKIHLYEIYLGYLFSIINIESLKN